MDIQRCCIVRDFSMTRGTVRDFRMIRGTVRDFSMTSK